MSNRDGRTTRSMSILSQYFLYSYFSCWPFDGLRIFQSSFSRFGCLWKLRLPAGDDCWSLCILLGDLLGYGVSATPSVCFLLRSPFPSEFCLSKLTGSSPFIADRLSLWHLEETLDVNVHFTMSSQSQTLLSILRQQFPHWLTREFCNSEPSRITKIASR